MRFIFVLFLIAGCTKPEVKLTPEERCVQKEMYALKKRYKVDPRYGVVFRNEAMAQKLKNNPDKYIIDSIMIYLDGVSEPDLADFYYLDGFRIPRMPNVIKGRLGISAKNKNFSIETFKIKNAYLVDRDYIFKSNPELFRIDKEKHIDHKNGWTLTINSKEGPCWQSSDYYFINGKCIIKPVKKTIVFEIEFMGKTFFLANVYTYGHCP
ncbi:hypothetical protein KKF34_00930 [Myxococcota bacterium]|nr:hypothetical protein [Myxococcota bacterium]MBU1381046.1 hypothetical protein [Myxococcota bacterium]MBU1495425.1 hypothetical protein [Myxococcota bacterium]